MSNAVNNPRYQSIMEPYREKKVIFIIDECHRSQFGKMHNDIKKHFKDSQYFGYTGTPRFEENTTADLFDKCLYHYLIKDAIHDGNVLGFSMTYINTLTADLNEIAAEKVQAIDTAEVWQDDRRIDLITNHIIDYHDQRARSKNYNGILVTDSIDSLILYYNKFKEIDHDFKIPSIYTYEANQDLSGGREHARDSMEYMIADKKAMTTATLTPKEMAEEFYNLIKS